MRRIHSYVAIVASIAIAGAVTGCTGGGNNVTEGGGTVGGDGTGTITGIVVQAPVSGATVTAYQLDSKMNRGAVLGTATTADGLNGHPAAGTYTLKVSPYNGPLELVASGGSYTDEATGLLTQMVGYDISAVVAAYQSGSTISATISPISSMVAAAARYDLSAHGTAIVDAVNNSYTHLNAHFGGVDWRTVVPADMSTVTNLTDAGTAALVLAALSQEASEISTSSRVGGTAGVTVTAAMLGRAIAQDAANGLLDGVGPSGNITLGTLAGTYPLDAMSCRSFLGTALLDYVQAHPALVGLTRPVNQIANAMSANNDSYLFSSAGQALNTQPPPVALVSPGTGPGPYYVNSDSVTITATATPVGNGVANVSALVQSNSSIIIGSYCSTCSPAAWQLVLPLTAGPNIVQVYATDNAGQGGATGCVDAGGGAPSNCINLTIVVDKTAPSIYVYTGAKATYYDESAMTVGTAVPPVYDAGGASLVTLGNGATIHKAATRIDPVATTPAVLESADSKNGNPAKDNMPWLQFGIALSGAPITKATYSTGATVTAAAAEKCSGGNCNNGVCTCTATGDLLPWISPQSSKTATSGAIYFDLPLDSVRISGLKNNVGATPVAITISVTDAAGNVGTGSATVNYNVIGAPINIAVDTGYAASSPGNSTYRYTIGSSFYGTIFPGTSSTDYSTFGTTQQVRLLRYVVTNPASQPVAMNIPAFEGSAWTMTETWLGARSAVTGTTQFNNSKWPNCSWGEFTTPCAGDHSPMYLPPGASGPGTGSYCNNDPGAGGFDWNGQVASSSLSNLAFMFQNGSDTTPPLIVDGRYVVPAATGSTPGVLSLYVTRPLTVSRTTTLGVWPHVHEEGTVYVYAASSCDGCGDYCPTRTYTSRCCNVNICDSNEICTMPSQTYNVYSYKQQLSSGSENWSGSLTPVTYGSDTQGSVFGAPSTGKAAISANGTASH